ncbi:MAG: hypothetical protein Rubg2KO_16200 [Rubricoccaceae bacterium]
MNVVLGLLLVSVVGCSSTQRIQSAPSDQPVALDGEVSDFAGAIRIVEGETGLSMGVKNDDDAVYVALVVRSESALRQILGGGLTLWLDPEGGKEKALGVRFPLAAAGAEARAAGRRGSGDEAPSAEEMQALLRERFGAALGEYEVVRGDGAQGVRFFTSDAGAVGVGGSFDHGELVLEYRIPLGGTAEYALGAEPGGEIGLGLATPEVERPAQREEGRAGRGGRSGGRSGGMGGRRGGGRGRGGQSGGRASQPGPPEPLNVWTRVELASKE